MTWKRRIYELSRKNDIPSLKRWAMKRILRDAPRERVAELLMKAKENAPARQHSA